MLMIVISAFLAFGDEHLSEVGDGRCHVKGYGYVKRKRRKRVIGWEILEAMRMLRMRTDELELYS